MAVDERLKNEPEDETPKVLHVGNASRGSREADDRSVTEQRELSDDDRLELFRMQNYNDVMPELPEIPGWHLCWLTTTNPRDSIHRRMRLGYEPVTPEEFPDGKYSSIKTGEWTGCIGVNEMIAFKLPVSLYQRFMQEAHHDEPRRQETAITRQMDALREQAHQVGGEIIEGDGMADLRKSPPRGVFRE